MKEKLSLPKGWEIKRLEDIAADIPYPIGDGDHGQIKPKDYCSEGIPYIRVGDMRWGEFIPDKLVYIPKEVHLKNQKSKLIPGDILIAKTGATIGKCCIVPDSIIEANTTSSVGKVSVDKTKVLPQWVLLWFLTPNFLKFIWSISNRAAQPGFNNRDIKLFEIPLPPLPEQQRIVSILDEAFAAIAKAKANAEQNLKNAKELFESYLQGVFENGNWETKTIEMVCDEIFAGGDAPKNNYSLELNEKHNIPIYANAVKDRGLYGYTNFARVTKPCVTIAARGSGTGHTELRNEHFLPIVRLIVCIPDTKQISTEFLKYTIDNLVIQRSGSAIPQLTIPMIKEYKIPVPSIEEQKLIIEKAETLKQQKENLESVYLQKIEGLEELKKSILQKAFAGELRGGEPAEPKTEKKIEYILNESLNMAAEPTKN